MATANKQKLEYLLECPICLIKLTNPRAFQCLHIYCKPCIDNLKPKLDGKTLSYECPLCRQLTANDAVRNMPFIHDLLEAIDLTEKESIFCANCKANSVTGRCITCKKQLCHECRTQHDRWTDNHEWHDIEDEPHAVVDRHVYCPKHPKELVKFNCRDCNELTCILCNGTEHKLHQAETIEDATKRVLTIVQKNKDDVMKKIEENEKTLASEKSSLRALSNEYEQMANTIDEKKIRLITDIELEAKVATTQLNDIKSMHIEEVKKAIEKMEFRIKSQKNVVSITETSVSVAQGTSLLQTLQSDVSGSLSAHMDNPEITFPPTIIRARMVENNLREIKLTENNVTDISIPSTEFEHVHHTLKDVHNNEFVLDNVVSLKYRIRRMICVKNEVWVAEDGTNKIHVFENDGTEQRTIVLDYVSQCYSVAEAIQGLAIAAPKGLYLIDSNGVNFRHLLMGTMCDVSTIDNKMFALSDASGYVYILTWNTLAKLYTKTGSFKVKNYSQDIANNTIQATYTAIYVSQCYQHCIFRYDHNGTLIHSIEKLGTLGSLKFPYICATVGEETIVIADFGNNKLLTLSHDGKWTRLNINDIKMPKQACVVNKTLFVAHKDKPSELRLYSIK